MAASRRYPSRVLLLEDLKSSSWCFVIAAITMSYVRPGFVSGFGSVSLGERGILRRGQPRKDSGLRIRTRKIIRLEAVT